MSFKPYDPIGIMTLPLLEEASLTAVAGNLVLINSSGYVAEVASDPSTVYGVLAGDGQNGSQGANSVDVYVIRPGQLWYATSNTTTAQGQVGANYGTVLSSSQHLVDISETGTKVVYIHALDPRQAVGVSGGKYIVEFITTVIQSGAGA